MSTSPALSKTQAIRRRLERQYVVVRAPEEFDVATVGAFVERVYAIEPNTDIVVDLRNTRFCGATAISALLDVERHVTGQESTLTLSCPPPILNLLLGLCQLDGHFRVRQPEERRGRRRGGADPSRR